MKNKSKSKKRNKKDGKPIVGYVKSPKTADSTVGSPNKSVSVDKNSNKPVEGQKEKKIQHKVVEPEKDRGTLSLGSMTQKSERKNQTDSKKGLSTTDAKPGNNKMTKKQKHNINWKQRQMADKLERTKTGDKKKKIKKKKGSNKVTEDNKVQLKHPVKEGKEKFDVKGELKQKVQLPKTALEATSNWKKLQVELSSSKKKGVKRKIPAHLQINPKHRKVEGKQKAGIEEEKQKTIEPEIWFDDVDEILLDRKVTMATVEDPQPTSQAENKGKIETGTVSKNPLVKQDAFKGVTKTVGMDCEMVGVGDGTESVLARVSIVNQYGEPVYDKFVKSREVVVDYRTHVSGVRPEDLENAEYFDAVQKEVADILRGKTLVGHAITNDLKVLYLGHPKKRIRDTSRYKKFRQVFGGRTPSLKKLSEKVLAVKVQEGEHNSIQDAQAAMRLYTMYRKQWEADIKDKKYSRRGKGTKSKKKP